MNKYFIVLVFSALGVNAQSAHTTQGGKFPPVQFPGVGKLRFTRSQSQSQSPSNPDTGSLYDYGYSGPAYENGQSVYYGNEYPDFLSGQVPVPVE